jgi:hypothetical protein
MARDRRSDLERQVEWVHTAPLADVGERLAVLGVLYRVRCQSQGVAPVSAKPARTRGRAVKAAKADAAG